MSKSQISAFITLGIVVVITAGIVFYISEYISKKQTQKDIKLTQQSSNLKAPLEAYVNTCIEKTLLDGLRLLGKQGGMITLEQGGIYEIDPFEINKVYLNYDLIDVLYALNISNSITLKEYREQEYPWACFPYLDLLGEPPKKSKGRPEKCDFNSVSFEGDFGSNILVPLHKADGKKSIQETLEVYINNNLSNCLDFSALAEQGLRVSKGSIKTTISILQENIGVSVSMPTNIIKQKTNEQYNTDTYKLNPLIRLGRVHALISEMINNDIADIKFDIKEDILAMDSYDENIEATITNDANGILHDDLLIIKDKASKIDDGFVFRFARKNRRPALHYIIEFTKKGKVLFDDFKPQTSDPDEDVFGIADYSFEPSLPNDVSENHVKIFKVTVTDGVYSDSQSAKVSGKK